MDDTATLLIRALRAVLAETNHVELSWETDRLVDAAVEQYLDDTEVVYRKPKES